MTSSSIGAPTRRGMNSYRLHLLSLHSAVENAWPKKGFLGRSGLSSQTEERVYLILRSLPFPLPLQSGGKPDIFFRSGSKDLHAVIDVMVDAAFVLLEDADLERVYMEPVHLLKTHEDGHLILTTWTSPKAAELLACLTEGLEALARALAA